MNNKMKTKQNKITIITGGRRSGKSTLLNKMIKDKKVCHINSCDLDRPFGYSDIEKDTDLIVIDVAFHDKKIKKHLKALFSTNKLTVNRKMQKVLTVETPDIIVLLSHDQSFEYINKTITGNRERYSIIKTVRRDNEVYSGAYKTNEELKELINKYTNKTEEFSISLGSYLHRSGDGSTNNIKIYKTQYKTESLTVI